MTTPTQDIMKYTKYLHNYLSSNIKLTEAKKPLLISATMLALQNDLFRGLYIQYELDNVLYDHMEIAIRDTIRASGMPDDKAQLVMNTMHFIKDTETLFAISEERTHLYHIITGLETHLFSGEHKDSDLDLLGKFYGEFIRYTGGDGSGLGIVLTPNHVTDLMCDLVDINEDSVVYDPCTGTGGFLITAMNKMIKKADGDLFKIEHIKQDQLHGVEMNAEMYTMAAANMIFKGDGKANLSNGSCFAFEDKQKTKGINVSILNPPYSQKKEGLREIDFILHAANITERNGKVTAIVPKSVFTNKAYKSAHERLLTNHSVDALITMPPDLFGAAAATATIIVVLTAHKPYKEYSKTYFYNFENDGYKTVKKQGRKDFTYNQEKQKLFEALTDKSIIQGQSAYAHLDLKTEWSLENYIEIDYSGLSAEVFAKNEIDKRIKEFLQNPMGV